MNRIYLLIFLLAFQIGILGQQPKHIKTGDLIVNYSLLKSDHILFKITLLDSSANVIYKLINDNDIIVDSTQGIVITSKLARYKDKIFENKSVNTLKTFSPLTFDEFNKPLTKKVEDQFKKDEVDVKSLIKNIAKDTVYKMPEGYFDDNVIEMEIGYFTLTKNVIYTANAFRFESNGNNPYEFEYILDDFLPSGKNGFIKCKVVKFKNSYLNGLLWFSYNTGSLVKEIGQTKSGSFILERI